MAEFYLTGFCAFAPGLHTVKDWELWARGAKSMTLNHDDMPDVSFIPAMMRRKLSQLAKMVLHVAHEINPSGESMPNVFSSRYGDWRQLSKQLARYYHEKDISPTGFSLSVHNATPGILSIIQRNQAPYTAIAAGKDSFNMGLVETMAALPQTGKIAYYYAEESPPDIYKDRLTEVVCPLALGLVFSRNGTGGTGFKTEIRRSHEIATSSHWQPLDFIKFILTDSMQFRCKNLHLQKLTS